MREAAGARAEVTMRNVDLERDIGLRSSHEQDDLFCRLKAKCTLGLPQTRERQTFLFSSAHSTSPTCQEGGERLSCLSIGIFAESVVFTAMMGINFSLWWVTYVKAKDELLCERRQINDGRKPQLKRTTNRFRPKSTRAAAITGWLDLDFSHWFTTSLSWSTCITETFSKCFPKFNVILNVLQTSLQGQVA